MLRNIFVQLRALLPAAQSNCVFQLAFCLFEQQLYGLHKTEGDSERVCPNLFSAKSVKYLGNAALSPFTSTSNRRLQSQWFSHPWSSALSSTSIYRWNEKSRSKRRRNLGFAQALAADRLTSCTRETLRTLKTIGLAREFISSSFVFCRPLLC